MARPSSVRTTTAGAGNRLNLTPGPRADERSVSFFSLIHVRIPASITGYRRLIIAAAIAEAILKTAVLIDIRRRPASQIRGSKRMWIVAAVLVNSAGVGPLSYFAFGQRQRAEGVELATPGKG
jgi:hypothetical protein